MCLNDRIDLPDKIGSFAAGCWWPKIELIFFLFMHSQFQSQFCGISKKTIIGVPQFYSKNFNSFQTKLKARYLY